MAEKVHKNKISYKSSELQEFYVAINPNIEIDEMGYVWFNSDSISRDNAYPNMLVDQYKNASSIHSNFINLKANLIYGSQGLIPMDNNNEAVKQALIKTNRSGENLNEIFRKMAMDYAILESAALQIVYDSTGAIAEVYHCSPLYLRAAVTNDFGFVEHYLYNQNWGIVSNKRNRRPANMVSDSVKIASYNPETGKEDQRQIIYIKKYTTGNDVYAIPSYNSGLNYVKLDFELSQFHLNKVDNSFTPTAIVNLFGNPDDEEKDKFVRNFKQKHTGTQTSGKILFMWNDGENQKPEFIRLESDPQRGAFEELNKIVNENIAAAHGASVDLAGISDAGASLGGDANKLNVSRTAFIDNVIIGYQNTLLDGINKVLRSQDLGEVTLVNDPLKLSQPIAQSDDLTRDERRSILYGLPPLDRDDTDNVDDNGVLIVDPDKVIPEDVDPVFNDSLAGLSGKQFINLMRIIRNIKKGSLTPEAGTLLLKNSYGLADDTISALIAEEAEQEVETI